MDGDDLDILDREAEPCEALVKIPRRRRTDRTCAQRQARLRRRRAAGMRSFRVVVDEDAVALSLLGAGLLTEHQAQRHAEVERALSRLVTRIIRPLA